MSKRIQPIPLLLWCVPLLYLAFVLLTVVRIFAEPLAGQHPPSAPAQTQEVNGAKTADRSSAPQEVGSTAGEKQQLDALKADIEKRSDDLQKLTSQLTLGNTVYTALLGLLAYFGLKEAKSDADRLIQNYRDALTEKTSQFEAMKQEFSAFKDEIRDDIPGLVEMQKGLRAVLSHVRMEVDMSSLWVGGEGAASYNRLTEEQRQKVILAEMAISSLDYFRLQTSNKAVAAEIFDGLTDFYAARATAMNDNAADLSRAFIYIDRACDIDPKTPIHFSRRGALTLTDYSKSSSGRNPSRLDKARVDFDHALSLDPYHPSSLYCLAWIMDEKGLFDQAIDLLTRMIDQGDKLPANSRGRRLVNAYVNRACARSKLLQETARSDGTALVPDEIGKVLADCSAAEHEAQAYAQEARLRGDMRREWSAGGELSGLRVYLNEEQASTVRRFMGS